MPRVQKLSEVALAEPKVECPSCGSAYAPAADGYCFDCRIPNWTEEEALAHKRFGPGIIGKAAWEYCQSVSEKTGDGKFGPALLGIVPEAYRDMTKPAA